MTIGFASAIDDNEALAGSGFVGTLMALRALMGASGMRRDEFVFRLLVLFDIRLFDMMRLFDREWRQKRERLRCDS